MHQQFVDMHIITIYLSLNLTCTALGQRKGPIHTQDKIANSTQKIQTQNHSAANEIKREVENVLLKTATFLLDVFEPFLTLLVGTRKPRAKVE